MVWSDYVCPWCYLGRDRNRLLSSLGVEVTALPYEVHPETRSGGRAVRPGGRLAAVHARVEAECAAVGLPFRPPTRVPNSRRALTTAEVVRARWPHAFAALDEALFTAHFARGQAIDDADVLDDLVADARASAPDVRARVDAGEGRAAIDAARTRAHEVGVASTPTWWIDERLLVPGALPEDTVVRWVTRLAARSGDAAR